MASAARCGALTGVVVLAVAAGYVPLLRAEPGGAQAEVLAAGERLREALRAGDADRLLDMYTPDARLMTAGSVAAGQEAIRSRMAAALAAGLRDVRLSDQELFVGDGIAVETGLAIFYDGSGAKLGTSRYMTLWKKSDGRWRIHRDLGVPVPTGVSAAGGQAPAASFATKHVAASTVVVLPMTGSYAQHGDAIARLAMFLGGAVAGPPFGRYYNSPEAVAEADLTWEVGFPVAQGVVAKPPFELRELPAQMVAFAVIPGPHEGTRPWPQLIEWARAQGYEIVGPAQEIWLDGPSTEMRVAVRR